MSQESINGPLPGAPELNETTAALARGRQLVKQAQKAAQAAGQQADEAQAAADDSDRVLDRAHELMDKISTE